MAANNRGSIGRGTARWKALTAELRDTADPVCHICGRPIDLSLPARHPESWSADHVVPLDHGGAAESMDNLAPAHYGCNSRNGALQPKRVVVSRYW